MAGGLQGLNRIRSPRHSARRGGWHHPPRVTVEHTRKFVISVLEDGRAHPLKDFVEAADGQFSAKALDNSLRRAWKAGLVVRSKEYFREKHEGFHGSHGFRYNTKSFRLWRLRSDKRNDFEIVDGVEYVSFDPKYLDGSRTFVGSKSRIILEFLERNPDKAFLTSQIVKQLRDQGVKGYHVTPALRRAEKKGLVYIRGQSTLYGRRYFGGGFIATWMDRSKPRERAIEQAIARSDLLLNNNPSVSPVYARMFRIRDIIYEHTKLRQLVSFEKLCNLLDCSQYQANDALKKAMQHFPSIREARVFDFYRYHYHESMDSEDLRAALSMTENARRLEGGAISRVGHNWEETCGWMIQNVLEPRAEFLSQSHRESNSSRPMSKYRILFRKVDGKSAEFDRIWVKDKGSPLGETTYIAEVKWGLIGKSHIDKFLRNIALTFEYGATSPSGMRVVKHGVRGVLVAQFVNPHETVLVGDRRIPLTAYVNSMNIVLLRADYLDGKLRERLKNDKFSLRDIAESAKDEVEVSHMLDEMWRHPERAANILYATKSRNRELFNWEERIGAGLSRLRKVKGKKVVLEDDAGTTEQEPSQNGPHVNALSENQAASSAAPPPKPP